MRNIFIQYKLTTDNNFSQKINFPDLNQPSSVKDNNKARIFQRDASNLMTFEFKMLPFCLKGNLPNNQMRWSNKSNTVVSGCMQ